MKVKYIGERVIKLEEKVELLEKVLRAVVQDKLDWMPICNQCKGHGEETYACYQYTCKKCNGLGRRA